MTTPRIVVITRVTGQDGAYLAELLPAKGSGVHGINRNASMFNLASNQACDCNQ